MKEYRVVADAPQQHVAIAKVDLLETTIHFRFLAKGLDGRDSRDIFLEAGVEPSQDQPALAIHLTRAAAVKAADIENDRKGGQANERQLPVEPKYHGGDAEDDRHIAQQADHTGAEQLI
jgi:hypothetical protein